MSQNRTRLDWVDTGRGLAIVLVALYHATRWLSGPGLDLGTWADISTVLSSMRMPLFFVLAGLFARKWLTVDWSTLFRSKLLLFAWVFVVWEVIGAGAVLLGLEASGKPINALGVFRDLIYIPVLPRFELWFIWALAWFFVVAKICRKVPPVAQLTVAGVLSAVALTVWLNQTTGVTGSLKFYFFFLAGLYLRKPILQFGATTRTWLLWLIVVAWVAVSVSFFLLDIRDAPGLYFINCLLGVPAGIAISRGLSRVAFLGRLGQQTLPIYLAHTPIIIVITFLISLPAVFIVVERASAVVPPIGAAVAVCLSLLLYRWSGRIKLRWLFAVPYTTIDRILARVRRVRE